MLEPVDLIVNFKQQLRQVHGPDSNVDSLSRVRTAQFCARSDKPQGAKEDAKKGVRQSRTPLNLETMEKPGASLPGSPGIRIATTGSSIHFAPARNEVAHASMFTSQSRQLSTFYRHGFFEEGIAEWSNDAPKRVVLIRYFNVGWQNCHL